mgnify:CR=1 FL=1
MKLTDNIVKLYCAALSLVTIAILATIVIPSYVGNKHFFHFISTVEWPFCSYSKAIYSQLTSSHARYHITALYLIGASLILVACRIYV